MTKDDIDNEFCPELSSAKIMIKNEQLVRCKKSCGKYNLCHGLINK